MTHYKNKVRYTVSTGITLMLTLTLSACQQTDQPTNPANDTTNPTATHNQQGDGEGQEIAAEVLTKIEFPVYIQGIPALLHPMTPINAAEGGYDISSLKSKKGEYYPIFEKSGRYDYRTYATNIVFEDITTQQTQKLIPHNNFLIYQVFFPHITRYIAKSPSQKPEELATEITTENTNDSTQLKTVTSPYDHVIYHISDTPYKEGQEANSIYKQQALYMSNYNGKGLIKLHPDNEFVQSTEWNPQVSRYYFITQSDSDNNGLIDEKDQRHNYQIDFKAEAPMARAYDFK